MSLHKHGPGCGHPPTFRSRAQGGDPTADSYFAVRQAIHKTGRANYKTTRPEACQAVNQQEYDPNPRFSGFQHCSGQEDSDIYRPSTGSQRVSNIEIDQEYSPGFKSIGTCVRAVSEYATVNLARKDSICSHLHSAQDRSLQWRLGMNRCFTRAPTTTCGVMVNHQAEAVVNQISSINTLEVHQDLAAYGKMRRTSAGMS